jgi:hypothetical protein
MGDIYDTNQSPIGICCTDQTKAPAIAPEQTYKNLNANFNYPGSPPWEGQVGFWGKVDSSSDSALVDSIQNAFNPNAIKPGPPYPEYIIMKGGVLDVDGLILKKVIVMNARILYRGGPIHLEGVYFVNCTFEWVRTKNTLEIANAILSPDPATNFTGE